MATMKKAGFLAAALMACVASDVLAQSTSGVPGPTVGADRRGLEYRIAYGFEEDGSAATTAQRFQYQQLAGERARWRVIGQMSHAGNDTELDYVGGQILLQLSPDTARYKFGLRFDAEVKGLDQAEELAVTILQQYEFTPRISGRFAVQIEDEIGDAAVEGFAIDTRARLSYRFEGGATVSIESFNGHGLTSRFGRYDEQNQQVGPSLSVPIGDGWDIFGRTLFGLSEASRGHEAAVFVGRAF